MWQALGRLLGREDIHEGTEEPPPLRHSLPPPLLSHRHEAIDESRTCCCCFMRLGRRREGWLVWEHVDRGRERQDA